MENTNQEDPQIRELRKKESGLIKINDVFGPPVTVKNKLFRDFLDLCAEHKTPNEQFSEWMDDWIKTSLEAEGYGHWESKAFGPVEWQASPIPNNRAFTRSADGEWALEYKIVKT